VKPPKGFELIKLELAGFVAEMDSTGSRVKFVSKFVVSVTLPSFGTNGGLIRSSYKATQSIERKNACFVTCEVDSVPKRSAGRLCKKSPKMLCNNKGAKTQIYRLAQDSIFLNVLLGLEKKNTAHAPLRTETSLAGSGEERDEWQQTFSVYLG